MDGDFPSASQGTCGHVWRHFELPDWGGVAKGIWGAEARDAAEKPTGWPPTTESYPERRGSILI